MKAAISLGLSVVLWGSVGGAVESVPVGVEDAFRRLLLKDSPPGTRIISLSSSPTPRGASFQACGLAEIKGHVEPFAAIIGPAPHTDVRRAAVFMPSHSDPDGDGVVERFDRGMDAIDRRMAMLTCPGLTPPSGVAWVTEVEPHPDPRREAAAKAAAGAIVGALFDSAQERRGD